MSTGRRQAKCPKFKSIKDADEGSTPFEPVIPSGHSGDVADNESSPCPKHGQCVSAVQRPDATRVAGLYAWNQLGRKVMKGQKGIVGASWFNSIVARDAINSPASSSMASGANSGSDTAKGRKINSAHSASSSTSWFSGTASIRDAALDQLRAEGHEVLPEDNACLSPLSFRHINMLGRYAFTLPKAVTRGELRPLRNPATAATDEP